MKHVLMGFVCVLVVVSAQADKQAAALYRQGTEVYKTDPMQAYELFIQAAEAGNPAAMVGVGHCCEIGEGTTINYTRAIEWYEKAVQHNSLKACKGLVRIYASCENPSFHDGEKAVKYAAAIVRGNPRNIDALSLLAAARARNYEFGKAVDASRKACGAAPLRKNDECKNRYEKYLLGTPFPAVATEDWLLEAANRNSVWAMLQLAEQYSNMEGNTGLSQARLLYEQAAANGSAYGMLLAGKFHWMGFGGPIDQENALNYFLDAEKKGDADAVFWAGYAYCCMRRRGSDLDSALNYFERIDNADQLVNAFIDLLKYPAWRDRLPKENAEKLFQYWKEKEDALTRRVRDLEGIEKMRLKPEAIAEVKKMSIEERCQNWNIDFRRFPVFYLLAAEKGHSPAARKVHQLFLQGKGNFKADPARAKEWARRLGIMDDPLSLR